MVAVKTGLTTPPPMPGMPAPMQPMGGLPPMALPAGQTPVPASMPPMPLAGFPPPPVKSPMAQQGSNAPRRRRFGDSLEGMLGRNMFAPQMQRPMPTPMMPRPMQMGGIVQGFANGGNANRQAAESMLAAGIGNIGGKAITPSAQNIQKTYKKESLGRRLARKRREEAARLAAEQAAAEAAALAASSAAVPEAFIPPSGGIGAAPSGFGYTPPGALPPSNVTPEVPVESSFMNIEQPDRSIDREIAGGTFDDDPAFTGALPPAPYVGPEVGYFGDAVRIDEGKVAPPVPLSPSPINLEIASDYPDMSMTAIPGVTTPDDIQPDIGPGFPTGGPGTFTSTGLPPAPDDNTSGTAFPMGGPGAFDLSGGKTDTGQKITPPKAGTGGSDKSKATPTEMITSYTDKDGNTTVDDPDTPENEAMLAQLGLLSTLRENQANPNIKSRDPTSVNAAEAAFLQEALGQMEFNKEGKLVSADPNFLEQVIGKVIRNLTFGMFDPNDPQKREDAKAILDAYRDTGKFIYDGEQMSIDELIEASKGDGIEPAVIGVGDLEGNTVGFDDGTGFRNTAEGTQNILTGSFDVFGDGDTTTNITTGGSDGGDDGGSDTTGDVDLGHTVDEDGNKICNTPGYIYNPETEICELPKEEEDDGTPGSGIGTGTGTSGESFEDVLKRVVVAAPDVAPISANVRPMQEGGMAGLNRAADNFLQALAG